LTRTLYGWPAVEFCLAPLGAAVLLGGVMKDDTKGRTCDVARIAAVFFCAPA
jgi:hypothetical protein